MGQTWQGIPGRVWPPSEPPADLKVWRLLGSLEPLQEQVPLKGDLGGSLAPRTLWGRKLLPWATGEAWGPGGRPGAVKTG